MKINKSPWIHQLDQARKTHKLDRDLETDIAIIGAGIAGIATAFFILRNTNQRVTILEGYKLAHGATGHNAGQVTSYFERPFYDIASEFGLGMATDGQRAVESAWELLDEIYTTAGLTIPLHRFTGYLGLSTYDQIMTHLKNNVFRKRGGLNTESIMIADDAPFLNLIPKDMESFYTITPRAQILSLLETENSEYSVCISYQKGCLNSALFTEQVMQYLLGQYPDRCALYEHTHVGKIVLRDGGATLDIGMDTVTAGRVILCSNGFENITIIDHNGLALDTKFHHTVEGTIGYMSGYLETYNKPPIAISYFGEEDIPGKDDPYFYLTRRQYEYEQGTKHNLICIGGPDQLLDDRMEYIRESDYPDDAYRSIDTFVKRVYDADPNKTITYQFSWHGLMGYTPNRLRIIGAEPTNPTLLYNLGCNGVGILPSLYGAKRISQILSGEQLPPSIFDPKQS